MALLEPSNASLQQGCSNTFGSSSPGQVPISNSQRGCFIGTFDPALDRIRLPFDGSRR
jgi:hypothetical protein